MDTERGPAQIGGMPLYFFSLFNDDVTMADEGLELDDDGAAMAHAIGEARAMAADTVLHGRFVGAHYIEIQREGDKLVGRVRFDEAVEVN